MKPLLRSPLALLGLAFWACAPNAAAQTADPAIAQAVMQVRAIDNHSHPPKLVAQGEKDDDYDALPCDPLEPGPVFAKLRNDNTQFIEAWKALYGYRYNDMAPEHVRELLAAKARMKQQQGDQYANWVLDQLGIETELANRVALGRGLAPPRFRWIAFADPLLMPRPNSADLADTPDRKIFYAREESLLARYRKEISTPMPSSLADYVNVVVLPVLAHWKQQGAVGIKFEAAYLRSLRFDAVAEPDAAEAFTRVMGGSNSSADYRRLQDFLFRRIALEAGRLGLPIQIHTGLGCGTYFKLADANPLNLESVLDDPALRQTKFVILHASWPFDRELAFLMSKPNVYADFSEITWFLTSREIAATLRPWLAMFPEKVLFGTDLSPNTPEVDWEEIGWLTTRDARRGLAAALSELVQDGVIRRDRALQYAHMAMHDNALKVYDLK